MTANGDLWLEVARSDQARALPPQGVLSIGSSPDRADLVVDGQGVADVHCVIGRAKGGGWALKDLGTEHGTLVNGKKVRTTKLAAGDRIVLGSRQIAVVDRAARERALEAHKPKIQGFRVEKLLGRGAMGSVWLAVQESLDRQVALKVLTPEYAKDAEFVRQFDAEAKAAAALHHANVVTLFDVGEDAGQHYLTMEYMDRGNLESRLSGGQPLPVKETLRVLGDAARGLVFAEQKGIVHRDIKPANLMQNALGDTKIADLGLATGHEADQANDGKVFGTPHFIAPEQAKGERVDARSDLYSLGATAYRLLTGRTPFEGETTRDILRGHFLEEPTPLTELVPAIPAPLAALVHRMLAKDPDDRPASAAAVLSEVEAIASGGTAPGAPATARRGRLVPALVVLALVLGGTAFVIFGRGDGTTAAEPAGPRPAPPRTTRTNGTTAGLDGDGDAPGATDRAAEPADLEGTKTAEPLDDDAALRAFEREARLALDAVPSDLVGEARIDVLDALVARFDGTDVAAAARDEIATIRRDLEAGARAGGGPDPRVATALAALRSATGLEGADPLRPGPAFRALVEVTIDPAVAQQPAFLEGRRGLIGDLARRAHADVAAELERIAELEGEGRFDDSKDALTELLATIELPPLPQDLRVGALSRLEEDARDVRLSLDEHDWRERSFAWRRERDDALAIGAALHGADGLRAELAALALGPASARAQALATSVAGAQRAFAARLARDCAAARDALNTLIDEFAAGRWRRRAVLDPRGAIESVRACDASGLALEDGRTLPWSDYGGRVAPLEQLFSERLEREWQPQEVAGIATLLRLQAVVFATKTAAEMLRPGPVARFLESEAEELTSGFAAAREWAVRAGSTEDLEREADAAEALAAVLLRADRGAWSATVVGLERLFENHPDALVVRLMSDGRGFVTDPPERPAPPPVAIDDGAAPEPPAGPTDEGR